MNIATGESELYYAPELEFDPMAFESKEIFYKSKDGTEVSLFIVHKKGLKLDGTIQRCYMAMVDLISP